MERKEVIEVMKRIQFLYPGKFYVEDERTIDYWTEALVDQRLDDVKRNLNRYVLANQWPPGISDLVNQEANSGPAVPTAEETAARFREYERQERQAKQSQIEHAAEIEAAQKRIREILGIEGE